MVKTLRPVDNKYYIGCIALHYPPTKNRNNSYYTIAYLEDSERELVNLNRTK